jgi:hypothetical protein
VAAGRACQLVIFGLTVASVLDDPIWSCAPRNLDVADLWSGVAAVSAAARQLNQRAETFDILDGPDQDICAESGFRKVVSMVMRVRENGLVGMAPVCSSFCTLNAANTKRSKHNLGGDETYLPVKEGNFMAKAAAFLLCLALARSVHAFLENPASSCLFNYLQPTLSLIPGLHFAITDRCCWSTEPFGQRYKKPWKFLSTGRWLALGQRCKCPSSVSGGEAAHLSLVYLDAKGRRCGNRSALKDSGAYPAKLGRALIDSWMAALPVCLEMSASVTLPVAPRERRPHVSKAAGASETAQGRSKRKAESQDPWPESNSDAESISGSAWPEDSQDFASSASSATVASKDLNDDWVASSVSSATVASKDLNDDWVASSVSSATVASKDLSDDWGWPTEDDSQTTAASHGRSELWADNEPWPDLDDFAIAGSSDSWPW